MPELIIIPRGRSTAVLQRIEAARKPAELPVSSVRQTIYWRYSRGETDLDIAKRMKLPLGAVTLTLKGFDEINRRLLARVGSRELRSQEPEVAAEVWADMRRRAA